jgi:hypothetical protein
MFDDDTVQFEILSRPTPDAQGTYKVDMTILSSHNDQSLFQDSLNFNVNPKINNQAINVYEINA